MLAPTPTLIEQALVTLATWSKVSNTVPEDVVGFQAWVDAILAAGIYDAEAAYKNLLTIRVEERVAFAMYRAVGFASVTGLVTP